MSMVYLFSVKLYQKYYVFSRRFQQAAETQDSAMTADNVELQQPQHPHYHRHHHHHHHVHHQHHRHHNNDNDDDKDDDDDERLSSAGDDYEQMDSNTASYASRALRHFTARATASVHDGDTSLHSAADSDWPPHTGAGPDNHLMYSASTTGIHDDISFTGNQPRSHFTLSRAHTSANLNNVRLLVFIDIC